MSYAQQHRSRAVLHQDDPRYTTSSAVPTPSCAESHNEEAPSHGDAGPVATMPQPLGSGGPQRTTSSLLRANSGHLQHNHAAAIDIAAWSEATSPAGTSERQPFQLLQHTPPKNEPPRLKASRKQFASPRVPAAVSDGEHSVPVSHAILVGSESPPSLGKRGSAEASLATDLRAAGAQPRQQAVAAASAESGQAAPQPGQCNAVPPISEMSSPSPIPFVQQPGAVGSSSSLPSSARLSAPQWPTSETFTARLRNIIETRQQIEALVQRQRVDEEELVQAIAALDEQPQQRHLTSPHEQQQEEQQQQQAPSWGSALEKPSAPGAVDRSMYDQVLLERAAALAALREFKEKGNAIVHKLYDTVKSQQEQSLELLATIEALKKANKRLREAVSNGGGSSAPGVPVPVAELQQKVAAQRRVIEQMDELMQNADRMLLAMRARVEAAERRAASATADRRLLPPLPKGSPRVGLSGESPVAAATVATPDTVAAIERLSERYSDDTDVATVAAQQQLLLDRIAQLRQALKQEQAQRLHLEEVYGATSEETARSVALLEERLQRAENLRGVTYSNGAGASAGSALRHELHTLLEGSKDGAPLARQETAQGNRGNEVEEHPPTPSHASSQASSSSSSATPNRTLFTAMSMEDGAVPTVVTGGASNGDLEAEEVDDAAAKAVLTAVAEDEAASSFPPDARKRPAQLGAKLDLKQPRAYLSRHHSGIERNPPENGGLVKMPLGIPVPEAASLGGSLRRSFNSRSSSASRRLVDFRPVAAVDATSQDIDSLSGEEEDGDKDDVVCGAEDATPRVEHHNTAAITGITPTVTPTAIHSASSPLLDTSTAAERSAVRQRRMYKQMEELDQLEVDVTDVVRSLDVN